MAIFGKQPKPPFKAPAAKPAEAKTDAADKPAEKKEKKPRGPLAKEQGGRSYRILIRPIATEKTSREEAYGKYQFIVANDANKVEVAAAVRDLYGVKPVAVRIVNLKGKQVRFGRLTGQQKSEKKAIVTLKPGETISPFEA